MAKIGWIKLHRSLRNHEFWEIEGTHKGFSKGQAWVDLLMRVSHKDNRIVVGNVRIVVKAGQLFTSKRKLAEDWGWSVHKVTNFFDMLEGKNDDLGCPSIRVQTKSDRKENGQPKNIGTLVMVINWELYQLRENEKRLKKTKEGTVRETYKNVKEEEQDIPIFENTYREDGSLL